jgi:hypothetical protein
VSNHEVLCDAMHRVTQNADIHMADVFVPDSARLTGVNSFQDTNKVSGT